MTDSHSNRGILRGAGQSASRFAAASRLRPPRRLRGRQRRRATCPRPGNACHRRPGGHGPAGSLDQPDGSFEAEWLPSEANFSGARQSVGPLDRPGARAPPPNGIILDMDSSEVAIRFQLAEGALETPAPIRHGGDVRLPAVGRPTRAPLLENPRSPLLHHARGHDPQKSSPSGLLVQSTEEVFPPRCHVVAAQNRHHGPPSLASLLERHLHCHLQGFGNGIGIVGIGHNRAGQLMRCSRERRENQYAGIAGVSGPPRTPWRPGSSRPAKA